MNLTNKIKSQIRKHALKENPRECCGFILASGTETFVHECANSSFALDLFRISPKDYLAASEKGKIAAVYHSHSNGNETFSEFDKFNSICHKMTYVLYSLKSNSFVYFDPSLSDFHKYIGKKFQIGKTDCYGLVRNFYKDELSINLEDHKRDKNWKSQLSELFDSKFRGEGFYEVDSLRKYDCILFRFRKGGPSSHIAVYLGNNL